MFLSLWNYPYGRIRLGQAVVLAEEETTPWDVFIARKPNKSLVIYHLAINLRNPAGETFGLIYVTNPGAAAFSHRHYLSAHTARRITIGCMVGVADDEAHPHHMNC